MAVAWVAVTDGGGIRGHPWAKNTVGIEHGELKVDGTAMPEAQKVFGVGAAPHPGGLRVTNGHGGCQVSLTTPTAAARRSLNIKMRPSLAVLCADHGSP